MDVIEPKHFTNKTIGHQKYKSKIDTKLLADCFHCSDGVFTTIETHNIW